jgi:hypothetical protein
MSDGHTWSAIFDIDEFLMMYQHRHIVDLLEEYASNASLVINWRLFGADGWQSYSPQPVSKRFRIRAADPHRHVKTIAYLSDVDMRFKPQAHHVILKKGKKSFDTSGNDVTGTNQNSHKPSDIALLYHFRTKSFKENIAKHERGRVDYGKVDSFMVKRAKQRKEDIENPVYDDSMWSKLKEYVPQYALYDILYPCRMPPSC